MVHVCFAHAGRVLKDGPLVFVPHRHQRKQAKPTLRCTQRDMFQTLFNAAFYCYKRKFISSQEIRALTISAHQALLSDGMNPGTGPRYNNKKKHNIFLNDQSPFCSGLLSILNITSAVSLILHAEF